MTAKATGMASGPLGAVQAADREIARQTALRARAVADFAATRPGSLDRQPGRPGCMSAERRAARADVLADVSEWAAQELVVALSISTAAAETLLVRSLTLVRKLPKTLAALEAGELHVGHLWPMLEKVAPITDDKVRADVETMLLAWSSDRVTTPAQLGAKATRLVLAKDARNAAGRLTRALRRRGVWARPDATDGMALLSVLLTVPEAQALLDALGRYVDALDDDPADGEPRTRGQKMADCLLDLVLRPGETDLPPVQAQVTLVASVTTMAGGDEPGEIGGEPVPAVMVRSLARAMGLLGATPEEREGAAPTAASERSGTAADGLQDVGPDDPAGGVDLCPDGSVDGSVGSVGRDDPVGSVSPFSPVSSASAPWADSDAAERELERWWAEVENRALVEEWGGEEAAPSEELERYWTQQAPWAEPDDGADWPTEPDDPLAGDLAPDDCSLLMTAGWVEPNSPDDVTAGCWAAADRALAVVGDALLVVDRALGRARGAVRRAEITDAADETTWQTSVAGRLTAAENTIAAFAEVGAEQRAMIGALLDASGGGVLVDRPRLAVVDALTGTLLALTDARELRRHAACTDKACRRDPASCTHDLTGVPGLGLPPPSPGYRPGAELDRWVRARDRRCRFPGCRARVPHGGELDHNRPWPDGPTSAENLTGFCTSHHRGKHQAPGWQHDLAPDGTLTVTTPTGLVAETAPPPF